MKQVFIGDWISPLPPQYGQNDKDYYTKSCSVTAKKDLVLSGFSQLHLKICCLGYYILKINHHHVTKSVLNNDWTCYDKRLYFDEYDISNFCRIGENLVEVEVGNGMYNPAPLQLFGKHNIRAGLSSIGEPKFVLNIFDQNHDLIIKTDKSWRIYSNPIKFNNLYLGEKVDFTQPSKELSLLTHRVEEKQQSIFCKSFIPKIKEFSALKPVKVQKAGQQIIYDFGRTISGFIKIKLETKESKKIIIRYAETKKKGRIDYSTNFAGQVGNFSFSGGPGAPSKAYEQDEVITQVGKTNFKNKFTYHSFRYAVIEGCTTAEIEDIGAIPVHTDLQKISNATTSNDFLNLLYRVGINTKLNNVHSVYEDCARERFQYGGDIVEQANSNLYTFDLTAFNRKVISDFSFSQTKRGGLAETAPYVGIQTNGTAPKEGPLLWQLVLIYLVFKQYQFYGDKEIIKQYFDRITKQYNYWMSWDLEQLAKHCIGDHGCYLVDKIESPTPDKTFVGCCTILIFAELYERLENVLGIDEAKVAKNISRIKQKINALYLNSNGGYASESQTSYAFAIAADLGDKNLLCNQLINKIKQDNYILTAGIFGQALIYQELHKFNLDAVVLEWLLQNSAISFKQMLANGNQVLSEMFEAGQFSANHAMFSSYLTWYYEAILGIEIADDAEGFNHIKIDPYFNKRIGNTEGFVNTIHGKISSKIIYQKDYVAYEIIIPNTIQYDLSFKLKQNLVKVERFDGYCKLIFRCEKEF